MKDSEHDQRPLTWWEILLILSASLVGFAILMVFFLTSSPG